MTYNYVTVTGSFPGQSGTVTFSPPEVTDVTRTIPVLGPGNFTYTLSGGSFTSVPLLATDNTGLLPAGWSWQVTVALTGKRAYAYPALIPAAGGTTATLSGLPTAPSNAGGLPGTGGTLTGALNMSGNEINNLGNGVASTDGANYGQLTAGDLAAVGVANQDGYATWTWDYYRSPNTDVPNSSLTAGALYLSRFLYLSAAITLLGDLDCMWHAYSTAGSGANTYVGVYSLSATTATLVGSGSADLTAHGTGAVTVATGVTSWAAGWYALGFLTGTLASGTNATAPLAAGGGGISLANFLPGDPNASIGNAPIATSVSYAGSYSALPSSVALSNFSKAILLLHGALR